MDEFVKQLNNDPCLRELVGSSVKRTNLTGGLLMSDPDGIGQDVVVFVSTDEQMEKTGKNELVALYTLGNKLTGHDGIVHGGLLATLLDECLCRCGFAALPHRVGVTAHLSVDYKLPTPAESIIALRARTTDPFGSRKAWVEGEIFVLDKDQKYQFSGEHSNLESPTMQAKLLVVEPKWWEKLVPLD